MAVTQFKLQAQKYLCESTKDSSIASAGGEHHEALIRLPVGDDIVGQLKLCVPGRVDDNVSECRDLLDGQRRALIAFSVFRLLAPIDPLDEAGTESLLALDDGVEPCEVDVLGRLLCHGFGRLLAAGKRE